MKAIVIVSSLSVNLREIGVSFVVELLQNFILQLIHVSHFIQFANNGLLSGYVVSKINLAKRSLSNFMLDLKLIEQQYMLIFHAIWTLFALDL